MLKLFRRWFFIKICRYRRCVDNLTVKSFWVNFWIPKDCSFSQKKRSWLFADKTATDSTIYKAQLDPVQQPKFVQGEFSTDGKHLRGFSASCLVDEAQQDALDIVLPADSGSPARLQRIDESRLPCRRRIEEDRASAARLVAVELDLANRFKIIEKVVQL